MKRGPAPELHQELEALRGQFAELERWAADSGELGSLRDWTLNAIRQMRPCRGSTLLVRRAGRGAPDSCRSTEAPLELAARVLERVQRFSMSVRDVMQRHVGTLEEETNERLNALAGDVVEHLYLRVLGPIWRRWPELEVTEAE